MTLLALILTLLSLAALAAGWVVAGLEGARAEALAGPVGPVRRGILFVWPFAANRGAAANDHARRAGKAQIAIIASVMVAVAAASIYTNLKRPRPAVPAPASMPAPAPSKS
ncbi:MAG: hypothetical protein B7Z45_08815 [Azorhizobium sp. 12-66-6]|nr:MAG: hypothetical protein B7Z45_08815 [Azorhizobium sp. 12-66-6]